jgi:hypothetical protein
MMLDKMLGKRSAVRGRHVPPIYTSPCRAVLLLSTLDLGRHTSGSTTSSMLAWAGDCL